MGLHFIPFRLLGLCIVSAAVILSSPKAKLVRLKSLFDSYLTKNSGTCYDFLSIQWVQ